MEFKNTIVVMRVEDGFIYFDCEHHAGDSEVCARISTLCNVLVCNCLRNNINPVQYQPGRVHVEVNHPNALQIEVFETVLDAFRALAEEYPQNLRLV